MYKVYYNVIVNHKCVAEIEADSEEDAIKSVEDDYSCYDEESVEYDDECEIEYIKKID